jgi:NhaP-type Na+/H+ or K+/H+ antiporter
MSEVVNAIGTLSLGAYVGWMGRYFIRRFKTFTPTVLGSLLSVMLGAVIIKFMSGNPDLWGYYPIGLMIGFLFYHFTVFHLMKRTTTESKTPKSKTTKNKGETFRMSEAVIMGDDLSNAVAQRLPEKSHYPDPPDVV